MQFIVDEPQSLKQFTDNTYAQASFYFTSLIKNKEIKVNGKKVGADVMLSAGDTVAYFLTKKQAERVAFNVVYQDENILLVDKQDGVNSEAVFAALSREGECYFIHRLDRNTRGLMIFAKNKEVEKELLFAFKTRAVEKSYLALCFGDFEKDTDILTAYLKKDAKAAHVKVFSTQVEGSEKIITEYKVLSKNKGENLVKVRLHTGKTHQIRAHLAFIGCPIVGDMRYGDEEKNRAKNCTRQRLISKELTLYLDGKLGYLRGRTFVSAYSFDEE